MKNAPPLSSRITTYFSRRLSLRLRLTLLLVVMSAAIQFALNAVRAIYLERSITYDAHSEIESYTKRFVKRLSATAPDFASVDLIELGKSTAPFLSNFVITVYDADGNLQTTSHQPMVPLGSADISSATEECLVAERIVEVLEQRDGHPERGRIAIQRFTGKDRTTYILAAATDYVAGDWIVQELVQLIDR